MTAVPLGNPFVKPVSPAADTHGDAAQWVVDNTITDWHLIGSCGMVGGMRIKDGVADEGLTVVNASIMPLEISSHPQRTVYAFADQSAAMILEDLDSSGKA